VDSETLRLRGVPEETVAAFRSEKAVSGQFPTVTVTEEPLVREVSATDYSDASMRSVTGLPGYKVIDTTEISVDGETVSLHVFSAQPVEGEPARRFYQVSTIQGSEGYTVTAAVPSFIDESLAEEIVTILKSVTFEGGEENVEEAAE